MFPLLVLYFKKEDRQSCEPCRSFGSLLCLTQAVVHGGEHSVAGHGSTGNSVHTAGGTGLGQLVCQSFSSGAAQFGSLAGCIDLHTGHPPPVTVTVTVTSLRQP